MSDHNCRPQLFIFLIIKLNQSVLKRRIFKTLLLCNMFNIILHFCNEILDLLINTIQFKKRGIYTFRFEISNNE